VIDAELRADPCRLQPLIGVHEIAEAGVGEGHVVQTGLPVEMRRHAWDADDGHAMVLAVIGDERDLLVLEQASPSSTILYQSARDLVLSGEVRSTMCASFAGAILKRCLAVMGILAIVSISRLHSGAELLAPSTPPLSLTVGLCGARITPTLRRAGKGLRQ
jgi:hypothetical protein